MKTKEMEYYNMIDRLHKEEEDQEPIVMYKQTNNLKMQEDKMKDGEQRQE